MPLKIYRQKTDSKFWSERWKMVLKNQTLLEYYKKTAQDQFYLSVFDKFLPKKGRIIEAGCGLGAWVYILSKKGYDIIGIDYAEETIRFLKLQFLGLSVKIGNVFKLNFPDNFFRGYISLGVIEHFEKNYEEILREAHRVLAKKGIIVLSIPYFNLIRKIKHWFNLYKQEGEFYQYAFSKREIRKILNRQNFKVLNIITFNAVQGCEDEIAGAAKIAGELRKSKLLKSIFKFLLKNKLIQSLFAHMLLIVGKNIK